MSSSQTDTAGFRSPAVAKLRSLLAADGIIVAPGVYDGFTARIALNAGFNCLYMTGAGTSMSRLGIADLGVATMNDMRDHAAMIASLDPNIPLIADADTGYGGPLMVGRTTYQYMRAGVAAFHIEDQVVNKRCGHLGNKLLVDEDEFISRIQAAANMRKKSNGDIVIIARSDALQSYGYDEAVRRLKSASKAGADMLFFEGLTSKEQCRKACQELAPTPVLLNMLSGGITPEISAAEAAEIGFKVVIFPTVALEPVYKAVAKAMATLKETGSIEAVTGAEAASMEELFESCGLKEAMEFDIAAGGHMYAKGV